MNTDAHGFFDDDDDVDDDLNTKDTRSAKDHEDEGRVLILDF
jgi:hypothetical protein